MLERALWSHMLGSDRICFMTVFQSIGTSLFEESKGFFQTITEGMANSGAVGVALSSKQIVRAKLGLEGDSDKVEIVTAPWEAVDDLQLKDNGSHISLRLKLANQSSLDFDADRNGARA